MGEQMIIDLGTKSVWLAIKIASPALFATLITGLAVSVFQAATQINEQTLTFIPKIFVMTIAMVYFGPWIMESMLGFTSDLIKGIPNIIR